MTLSSHLYNGIKNSLYFVVCWRKCSELICGEYIKKDLARSESRRDIVIIILLLGIIMIHLYGPLMPTSKSLPSIHISCLTQEVPKRDCPGGSTPLKKSQAEESRK